jgi:hypothetical protein
MVDNSSGSQGISSSRVREAVARIGESGDGMGEGDGVAEMEALLTEGVRRWVLSEGLYKGDS